MYENRKPMPLEDGVPATDGWTLIDDSKGLLFDGSKDWDWVTEHQSAEGAQDWYPISEQASGGWTGWDWNERIFPDYRKFLRYLDEQGVKATMNLHPADGVRPFEKKYQEFRRA